MTTFATLPLGSIVSSPTNPRKTFNAIKMAELAESIKASGKEGTITQAMDDNRWMVSFKGRSGGMCAFDSADLAVVEVAA